MYYKWTLPTFQRQMETTVNTPLIPDVFLEACIYKYTSSMHITLNNPWLHLRYLGPSNWSK